MFFYLLDISSDLIGRLVTSVTGRPGWVNFVHLLRILCLTWEVQNIFVNKISRDLASRLKTLYIGRWSMWGRGIAQSKAFDVPPLGLIPLSWSRLPSLFFSGWGRYHKVLPDMVRALSHLCLHPWRVFLASTFLLQQPSRVSIQRIRSNNLRCSLIGPPSFTPSLNQV